MSLTSVTFYLRGRSLSSHLNRKVGGLAGLKKTGIPWFCRNRTRFSGRKILAYQTRYSKTGPGFTPYVVISTNSK